MKHFFLGITIFSAVISNIAAKGATSLFEPSVASVKKVISTKAHWKKDCDFTAKGVLCEKGGKNYLKITYSGKPGKGVGIVHINTPVGSIKAGTKGMHVDGLSFDIGYEGKKPFYWQIFTAFKDSKHNPTLSAGIKILPGFHNYALTTAKWKSKKAIDWSKCRALRFFLYQPKSGSYPTIYLGKISVIEKFNNKPLSDKDFLPIQHQVVLVKKHKANAIAILPDNSQCKKVAETALAKIEQVLKVTFPRCNEKEIGPNPPKGNYILFSDRLNGPLSNRMAENGLVSRLTKGYEVRTVPNCFKNSANVLYIGGMSASAITQAVGKLLKSGKLKNSIANYTDISVPPYSAARCMELASNNFKELTAVYQKNSKVYRKNKTAFKLLGNIALCYYYSNNDEIVKLFCRGIDILSKNYTRARNRLPSSLRVPSFDFPALINAATKIDGSPTLTNANRLKIANIICLVMDDIMNFWEMRKPLEMYREQKVEFVENHCLFASRAVVQAANYLTERFNIPRANYYGKVAKYAFRGIDKLKQQPEDAGGYQFICRMHWMEICKKLGLNYNTPNLQYYIDFTIAQINQMGSAAAYGDATSIFSIYGWNFLLAGKQLNNDSLCNYLLGLQVKNSNSKWLKKQVANIDFSNVENFVPRMLGLTVFPVDRELLRYYHATNLNKKTPLNKSVFRSGYKPTDNYMLFGGMNSPDPHSQRDANTVLQYSRGPHYWLTDVSYFRKAAKDHNGVVISCNNRVTDQRKRYKLQRHSFAEIETRFNAPDNSMAIQSTSLNDYANSSWVRNIFWHKDMGFWCIDKITADKSADYVIKRRWRLLGTVAEAGNIFTVTQKPCGNTNIPHQLNIARGDDAFTRVRNQITVTHKHNGTIYNDYKYADPLVKIIVESIDKKLKKGQSVYFADRFTHFSAMKKTVEVRRPGRTTWISLNPSPQLVALGNFAADKLKVNGAYLFIADGKIMGVGIKKLIINGKKISIPNDGKLFMNAPTATSQILKEIFNRAKKLELAELPEINCPALKDVKKFTLDKNITALAMSGNGILCGGKNGNITMLDYAGAQLWQKQLPAPVTGIVAAAQGNKTYWAVGTSNFDVKSGDGYLALFDNQGKRLWLNKLEKFGRGGGYVRAITSAKLVPGNAEQIVVGLRNKKVIAFDLKGKKLWEQVMYHPSSTYIFAADMNGDGLDEIAVSELWRTNYIISPKGKKVQNSIRTIGYDHAVLAAKSAGKSTVIWGNDDSYIRGFDLKKRYGERWAANAGGVPTGLAATANNEIAVANNNNRVEFFDPKGHSTGKQIHFPAALLKLVRGKEKLYAACADGYLYQFTSNGISAKYKIQNFVEDVRKAIILKERMGKVVMAYGKNVYLIKQVR
jgi:putative pyrroloquinoline-quinone binding quinoprotein